MGLSIFNSITIGTILQILSYLQNPLVQKLLTNLAKKTANKVDDLVVAAIIEVFGNGELVNEENISKLQTRLNLVQGWYDDQNELLLAEAKTTESKLEV